MGTGSIIYIGLGANLGNRAATFAWALGRLGAIGTVAAVSPFYETESAGHGEQPMFLNAVARLRTELRPGAVLAALLAIELSAGRQQRFRDGPRPLDLDLLLYDTLVVDTADLVVPHPRLHMRAYMLVPLNDLAPDLIVPGKDATVAELLRRLESTRGVYPLVDGDIAIRAPIEGHQPSPV